MRRYSPLYRSPPRRGYGGRGRSPPPRSPPRQRGYNAYGGRREHNNGSLLVRNIPLNSRPEDIRIPFERFGPVRDVYLPKDYYTGEPRGFGFVQFVDPYDASEAQYHMNGRLFGGRELTVVLAAESRKRPEEMRGRERARGPSSNRRRSDYQGHSSPSRSRSPRRAAKYSAQRHSRSYSPAPRRHGRGHSPSPRRKDSGLSRSRSGSPRDRQPEHRSLSTEHQFANSHRNATNGLDDNGSYGGDRRRSPPRSAAPLSRSLSNSRSRSAESPPRR